MNDVFKCALLALFCFACGGPEFELEDGTTSTKSSVSSVGSAQTPVSGPSTRTKVQDEVLRAQIEALNAQIEAELEAYYDTTLALQDLGDLLDVHTDSRPQYDCHELDPDYEECMAALQAKLERLQHELQARTGRSNDAEDDPSSETSNEVWDAVRRPAEAANPHDTVAPRLPANVTAGSGGIPTDPTRSI